MWHCDQLLKIIKNDQRMLTCLKCEQVLEIKNNHAKEQKRLYQECLADFENIKQHVNHIKNSFHQPRTSNMDSKNIAQAKPSLKPKSSFEIDNY